jgi:hypothetical protein
LRFECRDAARQVDFGTLNPAAALLKLPSATMRANSKRSFASSCIVVLFSPEFFVGVWGN